MAQYKAGTVKVEQGRSVVIGYGTAFLANVQAGDLFMIPGATVHYQVGEVVNDATLNLTAPYWQESNLSTPYARPA